MGLSIVYGRILFQYGKGEKSRKYIKSIGQDDYHPSISTDMFSIGAQERSQFYDQQVVAFAATYKNVEYDEDFKVFILKFEKILRELEFDTVHIELEAEIIGTYRFFWRKIGEPDTLDDRYTKEEFQLIRTNEWYFGYGYRSEGGFLNVKLEDDHIFSYNDFTYPVEIPNQTLQYFKPLLEGIKEQNLGEKFYVKEFIKDQWASIKKLYFLLSKLQIEEKIDFEYEGKKGYSVTRIKEF